MNDDDGDKDLKFLSLEDSDSMSSEKNDDATENNLEENIEISDLANQIAPVEPV